MSTVTPILPEALQGQFQRLERRLWWADTILAGCGSIMALIVSYALLFVSDRIWDTPSWLRAAVTLAGLAAAGYFAWGWMRHWWVNRRDARDLSAIVQKHYRRLGDRLLGIVELADESKRPANVSPELCRAAIQQVSREAMRFDFRQAVATRRPRVCALAALGLLLVGLAPWVLVPEASWNTLHRWLWPAGDTPRYTFASVENLPGRWVVAHGEPFEISFGVRFHRWWQPDTIAARMSGQPAIRVASAPGGRVTLPIPGQTQPGDLTVRAGDVTRRIHIEPVLRPALKSLRARIRYPDYLGHPPREQTVDRGSLRFLEGSRVSFAGRATRALASASFTASPANGADAVQGDLTWDGETFQTGWLDLNAAERGVFVWTDHWGLTSAAPWRVTWQIHGDESPTVDCPGQAAVVAILEEEILEIDAVARDDFGVRDLVMVWNCQKPPETNQLASGATTLAEGTSLTDELRGTFKLAPALMKLPADSLVTLRAEARDYYPERAAARSIPFRVYILSHEEHARLVQQELEKIMAELEETARRQETVLESGRELVRQPADAAEEERRLRAQAAEQSELARRLESLAERTAATLQEALRNKSIPTDLLQEWTGHAQAMRDIARQPMAGAAQALQAAQANASSRPRELGEAIEREQDALRRLMALQQQLGPAMDRMLANTLVQRFRRVAQVQAEVRHGLQMILPRTIGLNPEELEPAHAETLAALAREESRAREESSRLQNEVSRFYERTVERVYGTVAREMKTMETVEALGDLTELIAGNVGATALREADVWRGRFETWAEKLEQTRQQSEAAAGQGGGSMSEEALRRMLALMRLRIRELALREHTRYLEEGRETNQGHREDSIMLSLQQMFMREDVNELDRIKPGKFLPHAARAMTDAENLLMQPDTGPATVAAETDAVNLLESEMNEMMKNAQGSGMVAAMSLMMQMMGMNSGTSGGGSLAGGDTDGVTAGPEGNMNGSAEARDDTERVSGGRTRPVPAEYREAMQRYHKALETLNTTFEFEEDRP